MKKRYLLTVVVASLFMWGCYSGDDGDFSNRVVWLRINDAITLDNQENYSIGDTLFFELNFSRYLQEEGFNNPLDIYETTKSEEFGYTFEVRKYSEFSDRFEFISIDPQFILGSRASDINISFQDRTMAAVLDDSGQSYSSMVGLILQEEGRFELDLDFMRIQSPYPFDTPGRIQVNIEHSFSSESTINTEFEVIGE